MDPATLAVISLAATAIGTGVSFVGGVQTAAANKATAEYQAQVAKNNETIAKQNADYARQAGQAEVEQQGMKTRAVIGQEAAAQGASGIDLTTGSPEEVRRSTQEIGQFDDMNIVQRAEMRARGFDIEAMNQGASARLYTQQGRNASTAGMYAGFSSLLTGGSSFSDKWLKYKNEGTFGSSGTSGDTLV